MTENKLYEKFVENVSVEAINSDNKYNIDCLASENHNFVFKGKLSDEMLFNLKVKIVTDSNYDLAFKDNIDYTLFRFDDEILIYFADKNENFEIKMGMLFDTDFNCFVSVDDVDNNCLYDFFSVIQECDLDYLINRYENDYIYRTNDLFTDVYSNLINDYEFSDDGELCLIEMSNNQMCVQKIYDVDINSGIGFVTVYNLYCSKFELYERSLSSFESMIEYDCFVSDDKICLVNENNLYDVDFDICDLDFDYDDDYEYESTELFEVIKDKIDIVDLFDTVDYVDFVYEQFC